MKKLLSLFVLISLVVPHIAGSSTFGPMRSIYVGISDPGTVTSTAVNTNFNFGVAGRTSVGLRFVSERDQTGGNLTLIVYCTAVTGTPSNSEAVLYATTDSFANDAQRPNSTATATSTNTDMSGCGTAGWKTYSFTGVTLTAGQHYFIAITNTTATPASNNFSVTTRGGLDGAVPCAGAGPNCFGPFMSYTNTDGFTTDPTIGVNSMAPMVLKYNDGTLAGNPFVTAAQTHSANTNMRGFRVLFDEDVTVIGAGISGPNGDADIKALTVYNGAVQVASSSLDRYNYTSNSGAMFGSAVTLSGGISYDFVLEGNGGNITTGAAIYDMGNSPPADVAAVNTRFTYVTGAAAGSLIETATSTWSGWLLLDNNPAVVGGGGGTNILGNIIQ